VENPLYEFASRTVHHWGHSSVSWVIVHFIDTCLPLLVSVREGSFDDHELEQMSVGFEHYFKRDRPYALLNVSHVQAPSVDAWARMQVAAWVNEPRVQIASRRLCTGSATVVARPWERHAMTAIQWLWTPVAPHQPVNTVSEGIAYCLSSLVEAGIALPGSPEALGAELSRVLHALPIAGLARDSTQPAHDSAPSSGVRHASDPDMKTFSDEGGCVAMSWVGESVLWARFSGHLSRPLASAYAAELELRLACDTPVRYFVDASSLDSYDLLARTAAVRAVVSHRHRLRSLLVLNWSATVNAVGRAIMAAVGSPMKTTTSRPDFEASLLFEAPLALQRLDGHAELRLQQYESSAEY
jgi:hypothetical protein